MRAILIQGDSVRMAWGIDEETKRARRPLRREASARPFSPPDTEDTLRLRFGEELDYVRRMIDSLGEQLSCDPILIRRHAVALQSLDMVAQVLGHLGDVIRSSDPHSAVAEIGMGDLKARLTRSGAL